MHRVWAYWVVRCGRLAPLAALLLLALPSLAWAQLACGGHYIDYIGAPLPRAAFPGIDQHGPPTVPTPPEMTAARTAGASNPIPRRTAGADSTP